MANDVTIGTDVTAYAITMSDKFGNNGSVAVLLGQWESITVEHEKIWADTTSSDAPEPEGRKRMDVYRATLKNFVRESDTGSRALEASTQADFLKVFFTTQGGQQMSLHAGITKTSLEAGAEAWKDTLELESKGRAVNGVPSLAYVTV